MGEFAFSGCGRGGGRQTDGRDAAKSGPGEPRLSDKPSRNESARAGERKRRSARRGKTAERSRPWNEVAASHGERKNGMATGQNAAVAKADEWQDYTPPKKEEEGWQDYAPPAAGKPIGDQGSIRPGGMFAPWSPGHEFSPLAKIENYTQEGRKEHPILSRIGDATRNAKEMLRVVGPEIALLAGAPGGMNPAIGEAGAGPRAVPERLSPIGPEHDPAYRQQITQGRLGRAPEEIYQRPIEPAPGAGKGPAPAEMHPEELAAIRKEAGNAEMTPQEAHRFRINKMASAAAAEKPANDLGGMPRAGEEPTRLPSVGEKARSPRGYFNLGRGTQSPSIEDVVNQATGVKPLKPDVPLREQLPRAGTPAEVAPVDPIKAKYPDPAVRQMVRANGERIVEAVGKNPELMKAVHDLTRVELRQALINAGADMGQATVSNSKFAGEGSIGRQEAFDRLLKKGITPEKIVELAKQKPEGLQERAAESVPDLKVGTVEVPKPSRLGAQRETRERAARIRAARLNP